MAFPRKVYNVSLTAMFLDMLSGNCGRLHLLFVPLDEKLDLHIQQMWRKYKGNATFDHVCSNLLLSVGPTLPHFYTQSKAGKCHICDTFATVGKSTDNMFFFTTFGCVAILMPNEAFCKYFA